MENNSLTSSTTQINEQPVIIIPRNKFIKLTKNFCIAQYMVRLLSAVGYILDIKYTLTPEDASQYLGIDFPTFQKAMKKLSPRYTLYNNNRVYSIESMAKVAEVATRLQRLERLKIK